MENNETILKVISNETINAIHDINIVTPSIYKSFFEKHAIFHGTELDDEEKLTDRLLDSKIQMCNVLQETNSQNALKLSTNANKAMSAIKAKDEALLSEVLKETNTLRKEIEKLKEAVYKDELTNVFNRKWMHDKFLNDDNDDFKKSGTLAIL